MLAAGPPVEPEAGMVAGARRPITWPHTSAVSINRNITFEANDIRAGFRLWESVADGSFRELSADAPADLHVVRLGELKSASASTRDTPS